MRRFMRSKKSRGNDQLDAKGGEVTLDLSLLQERVRHTSRKLETLIASFLLDDVGNPFPHSFPLAKFLTDHLNMGSLTEEEVHALYRGHGVLEHFPTHPATFQWNQAIESYYYYSMQEFLRKLRRPEIIDREDEAENTLAHQRHIIEEAMQRWEEQGDWKFASKSINVRSLSHGNEVGSLPDILSEGEKFVFIMFNHELKSVWSEVIMEARGAGLQEILPFLRTAWREITENQDVTLAIFRARNQEPTVLAMIHFLSLVNEYNLEWAEASMEWNTDWRSLPLGIY